jgi:hypothetical protein
MQPRNPQFSDLNSILKDEEQIIRIYITTGNGFGNQAANLNLLRHIRSIGYKGTFEVIFSNLVRNKILDLFGLSDNTPTIYDDCQGIVFYALSEHIKRYLNCELPPVQLALTGAWDNNKIETQLVSFTAAMVESMAGHDLEKYTEDNEIFINFANLMNAEVFIRYSAFQERHSLFTHTVFHLRDNTQRFTQFESANKFLVAQPYSFADAYKFLDTPRGKHWLEKRPALAALMSAYQNKNIKVMPCYGYTLLNHDSPQNLISMLVGARYAQLKSQANYSIILPFFAHLDPLAITEIEQTLEWARSTALRAAIDTLELKSAVTIATLYDGDNSDQILNLAPGKILLLATGALPNIIFNALYTYSGPNLLLQVREGPSSFVSLRQTGKPHFRCGGVWELGFDDIHDPQLSNQFMQASQVCGEKDEAWESVDVANLIGEYILSAQDPTSSLSHYFKNLSLKAQDPQNDRILAGLTQGVEFLGKTVSWQYADLVSGDYYPVIPQLPHCRETPSNWLDLLSISLPLLFFMLLLARKVGVSQTMKYHHCKQMLFGADYLVDMKTAHDDGLKYPRRYPG